MKMHFKIAAAAAAMAAICSMTAWAKDVANVDTCVIENGYITVSGRAWEEPDPVPETAAAGTAADGSAAAGSTAGTAGGAAGTAAVNADGTPVQEQPVIIPDDGKYYLFELQPYEENIGTRGDYCSVIDQAESFNYQMPFYMEGGTSSRLFSRFVVAVCRDGKYEEISNQAYITNPESVAAFQDPYPEVSTKKGLLIQNDMTADAFELGVKYVIINIPFHHILDPNGALTHEYNGKTYHFNKSLIESYDNTIRLMTQKGMVVSAIVLNGWNDQMPQLIYPGASKSAAANYYMFNTVTKQGFEDTMAIMSFLAERYSGANIDYGRVSNWIIGNEINNNEQWNYAGPMAIEEYVKAYEHAFRVFYSAIKSQSANARVFFSTDFFWNQENTTLKYGAKDVIDLFNQYVREGGQMDWGLAYHPYPLNLTEPEFWLDDGTGRITDSFSSPVVNFKTLHVLTDYFQQDVMRNASGSVRHIILSEQGFTSKSATRGDVPELQAAAFAYAYFLVDSNPYIDAFILSRQVDAISEVNQFCAFGLWTVDMDRPDVVIAEKRKKLWEVFKYIDDGKEALKRTEFAKPLIGISKWSDVIPNFKYKEE